MIYFYITIAVISGVGLIFDVILRYTEKIKSFGLEKKLFKFEGKTIPAEKLLPQNITMLLAYFLTAGITGILFETLGVVWFLSLPCALFSGCLFCFFVQYPLVLAVKKFKKLEMPRNLEASGIEGYLTNPITASEYGTVKFTWRGEVFEAPAFSANETELPEFEKVIIILEENGCYCVEGLAEVYTNLQFD